MATGDMDGRVTLVTGAARNIGRAIALRLAAAGSPVVLAARSDEAGLAEGVEAIRAAGGVASHVLADVTDPASVARMVETVVERHGRLDVLVNNASLRVETAFDEMTFEDWRAVLAVILDGSFLCIRAALPHLAASGTGAVINLGGMTAHTGAKRRAHVVSAKSAIVGLTRALAVELAPRGITVNVVAPGRIATVRGASAVGVSPSAGSPAMIGRRGRPEEIAAAVHLLAGPDGRYTTGQTYHVNGGSFMP